MRQTTQAAALPSSVTLEVVFMCLRMSQVDNALRRSGTPSPRRTLSSRDRCCDDRRDWQVRYVTVPGRGGATAGVKPGAFLPPGKSRIRRKHLLADLHREDRRWLGSRRCWRTGRRGPACGT